MKSQWYNPIDILKPALKGILNHLIDNGPSDIKSSFNNESIDIHFDITPAKIKTPVADLENGNIEVQDIHLAFLWCFSYITVALNTMLYEEVIDKDEDIVALNKRPEFPKTWQTIKWARSLQKVVSAWPADIARPDRPDKWTRSANKLFQACVAYLVFHETAHILLHKALIPMIIARRQYSDYLTSDAENKKIFEAEVEADKFALNCLLHRTTNDDNKLMKYLGASLAHLSNFYLLDIPDTRGGRTHPDLDDRLKSVLNQVNFNNEANMIQFRMHNLAGLQLFFILTETPFMPEQSEKNNFPQIDDLEKYLFGLITKMKNAARGITCT